MSRPLATVLVRFSVLTALVAGTTVALANPARAESGDGHTGWAYWTQGGVGSWSGQSFTSDPTTSVIDVTGAPGNVRVSLSTPGQRRGPNAFTLAHGCIDAINAGAGTCADLTTNDAPGTDIGSVTIHEAVVVEGAVTRLSLTYDYGKDWWEGRQYGSIAWHATAPAQPLPGIVGVNPDPVGDFTATADYGLVNLAWTSPFAPDWSEVQVWFNPGTKAPGKAGSGYLGYKGRAESAVVIGLHPSNSYAFAIFTKDSEGRWSTRRTAILRKSTMTMKTSSTKLVYGGTATLSGRVSPAGYHDVLIMARRPADGTWYSVDEVATDAEGYWYTYVDPALTYDYYAYTAGSESLMTSAAGPLRIAVAKDVVAWSDKKSARKGSTFKISAGVNPVAKGKTITLQRYSGGKWRTVSTAQTLGTKATVFSVKPSSRGTYSYRVTAKAGSGLAAGKSVTIKLKVT